MARPIATTQISIFALIAGLFAVSVACADDVADLKSELERLKQENSQLRDLVATQADKTDKILQRLETIESAPPPPPAANVAAPPPMPMADSGFSLPKLDLKGFADVGYYAQERGGQTSNSFTTADIDFFINSEIADDVDFLFEADWHSKEPGNGINFTLQRASITYRLYDYFNINVGRVHTAIGYYNQNFHHGNYLMTTVIRPEIMRFERDAGGFLPVHGVGIEFFGNIPMDGFDLEYNLSVLNGRDEQITGVAHLRDRNNHKALNMLLNVKPHWLDGLEIGGVAYLDRIPPDQTDPLRSTTLSEEIFGGFVVLNRDNFEYLSEIFFINQEDQTSGMKYDTVGAYAQIGYGPFDKLTPYYRFDYVDLDQGNPYYTPNGNVGITSHSIGVRWDAYSWNAIKFEYSYGDLQDSDSEQQHAFRINSSFPF
ncbi:MAG: hypothetical protein KDD70_10985 [Bdellovibrionales bacterium]|nr:hypothetical protein [Bdellovibrionales bacterium]